MPLFVMNKGDKTHVDRFDGKEYEFNPGEVNEISHAAAAHIFKYGQQDKTDLIHRLGAFTPGDDGRPVPITSGNRQAVIDAFLEQFVFEERDVEKPTADQMTQPAEAPAAPI